jgi:hypothetical protein
MPVVTELEEFFERYLLIIQNVFLCRCNGRLTQLLSANDRRAHPKSSQLVIPLLL